MEIYVHIPFCVRKCAYCDFYSLPDARSMEEAYFEALKEEIKQELPPQNVSAKTIPVYSENDGKKQKKEKKDKKDKKEKKEK